MAIVRQWDEAKPVDWSKFKRLVIWYSCGATSAVAAKQALQAASGLDIEVVVAYCDVGSEHDDNERFIKECEAWLGVSVVRLKNKQYADTWAVWEHKRYISGIAGAPCTQELKKRIREQFGAMGTCRFLVSMPKKRNAPNCSLKTNLRLPFGVLFWIAEHPKTYVFSRFNVRA